MTETLKLSKTLETLSGDKVEEIKFDFSTLTPLDYRNIVRLESRLKGIQVEPDVTSIKITSSEFRMATAWVAAVNVADNKICFDDIDRLSLADLLKLEQIGVFFIADVV